MPNTVELSINGSFYLTFKALENQEQETDEAIYAKLKSSDYVIALNDKKVLTLDGLKPIYTFELEVSDSTEYYWDLLDEEELNV